MTVTPKLRPRAHLYSAVALVALGCFLLIAGFFIEPPGEIHNSVLVAFGETSTFAGALFGINYRYAYGTRHDADTPQSPTPENTQL